MTYSSNINKQDGHMESCTFFDGKIGVDVMELDNQGFAKNRACKGPDCNATHSGTTQIYKIASDTKCSSME
jgi:hypothetical protein